MQSLSHLFPKNPAMAWCRKKKTTDNASFLEDVKEHLDEFINASMDEHKSCFKKTVSKIPAILSSCCSVVLWARRARHQPHRRRPQAAAALQNSIWQRRRPAQLHRGCGSAARLPTILQPPAC
uniref:Uncharacterized protein n=1 Tax=Avena sativa TaxID=4498 RepID=A0ACD5XLR8_AVESA